MKGTDVTKQQLDEALAFLEKSKDKQIPEKFAMTRTQLVTLMAWYAAVRGNGDGSGSFVSKREQERAAARAKEAEVSIKDRIDELDGRVIDMEHGCR